MAERGRYTPVEILQRIARLAKEKKSKAEISRACDVSPNTVEKYLPATYAKHPRGRPSAAGGS